MMVKWKTVTGESIEVSQGKVLHWNRIHLFTVFKDFTGCCTDIDHEGAREEVGNGQI